jgi:hypothetical protein
MADRFLHFHSNLFPVLGRLVERAARILRWSA